MTKRAVTVDVAVDALEGEGRWLIVKNEQIEPISVPHPDRDARDNEHLDLSGFEEQILDEVWLSSPVLMRDVERGRLSLRRSDHTPQNEFTMPRIVSELTGRGWQPHAAVTIWQMCASDPIPPQLDYLIELEPSTESKSVHGPTSITDRWDLIANHLPWLREVRDLEARWRNRRPIIRRLDSRIEELERMARGL